MEVCVEISTMKCFKLLTMDQEYLNISWQQSNCIRILYDNDRRSLRPTNPAFLKQFPILVHENTNVILKVRHKVSITYTWKRMSTTGIQYCFVFGKKEIVGCLNTSAPFLFLFLVQHTASWWWENYTVIFCHYKILIIINHWKALLV